MSWCYDHKTTHNKPSQTFIRVCLNFCVCDGIYCNFTITMGDTILVKSVLVYISRSSTSQPNMHTAEFDFVVVAWSSHAHGLVQDCSISSALAMDIQQSCTKPLMYICTGQTIHARITVSYIFKLPRLLTACRWVIAAELFNTLGLHKMADILQTILWNSFSWMKFTTFWFKF